MSGKKKYQKGDLDPIFLKKEPRQEIGDMLSEHKALYSEVVDATFYGRCKMCTHNHIMKVALEHGETYNDQAAKCLEQWRYQVSLEHWYDTHHSEWLKLLVRWKLMRAEVTTTLDRLLQGKL